ncbi:dihydrofolate reductase family protein [Chitinophaga arvensicola]|uniref:Dihydrofolate reductase n=1 Tax=Chitinophaga arvensicola TaxID=29529 RepID=A0A1I0S6S1_9BACT|nr:dihydrofolate reductase family protein [Chitinophaga arvensicola]SEW51205.1 Dihydrofolate reductase [Chitinophaga arvensicola]
MRKIVSFMHLSLDGFVAGPAGEMNWIHVNEELFDFAAERTNASDTALYGRVTYDMMEGYWPTAADKPNASKHDREHSAWYNKVNKIVLSHSLKGLQRDKTTVIGDDFVEQIKALKAQPGGEIVIFGSPRATQSLIQHGLVDEFWLFVNPVILGEGMPYFKGIKEHIELKLVKSTSLESSGVVCLHYVKQ